MNALLSRTLSPIMINTISNRQVIRTVTKMGTGIINDQMIPTSNKNTKNTPFKLISSPKTLSIIGAPMTYGQPYIGTDTSPTKLREIGLLQDLSSLGWRVNDLPDLNFNFHNLEESLSKTSNARHSSKVGKGCLDLAKCIEQVVLKKKHFPLILGGDHSIGIGSLAAMKKCYPNIGVIWIDAHADLNTPDSSPSGNMHGMSVAMNMQGLSYQAPQGCEWLSTYEKLNPSDSFVYIGLRDVDAPERKAIEDLSIKTFTMYEIDRYGIGNVMEMAVEHLLQHDPDRPIHVSVDIDATDPYYAPATGTAVRGGLTFREMLFCAEFMCQLGNLVGLELVELNPNLGKEDKNETMELGKLIITSFLGKSII